MLRHKNIDRICCVVLAVTLLLTCGYMGAAASGVIAGDRSMGYENRLFDQSRVHTLDIVIDDWEGFLDTCTSEEYSVCTVVIDGENFGSVGIRGKGNTSLSSVQSYGNDRYSFKVEFDHYQNGKTYHGLDKLSLNNLIQDKTYMKDYLAYTLMNKMGVAAPLCSFVQINVNGEPWGLYLAVEGVEDSFLSRNYGSAAGELYKPDSMSFGGGRGNGMDFDMDEFREKFTQMAEEMEAEGTMPTMPEGFDPTQMPGENFDPFGMKQEENSDESNRGGRSRSFGGGGMGSSDVMLQYVDDDPSSYLNIFNNAKTDVTEADQQRLIKSLKTMSEGENIESVVDTEAVIRYLVVHNFLCNDDSYTGTMVHNYYLHEDDGVLSMIPWDYNLAFGAFGMGGMGSGATSTINSPIDSPVSSGDTDSRPIISWIFESEEYTQKYHELYAQFVAEIYESGWIAQEIGRVSTMIAPYVEAETRAFFTYDEFKAATEELSKFCDLRFESISGQLNGSIPSTNDAQRSDSSALIDGSDVDLSAMGEFNMGDGMRDMGERSFGQWSEHQSTELEKAVDSENAALPQMPAEMMPPGGMQMSMGGMQALMGNMPAGEMPGMNPFGQMPDGQQMEQPVQNEKQTAEDAVQPEIPADDEARNAASFAGTPGGTADALPILAGSLILLAAAILFAKLYKVNR